MRVGTHYQPSRGSNGLCLAHRLAGNFDLVGATYEAIEDRIGQGGFAEALMPLDDAQLAGDWGAGPSNPSIAIVVGSCETVCMGRMETESWPYAARNRKKGLSGR